MIADAYRAHGHHVRAKAHVSNAIGIIERIDGAAPALFDALLDPATPSVAEPNEVRDFYYDTGLASRARLASIGPHETARLLLELATEVLLGVPDLSINPAAAHALFDADELRAEGFAKTHMLFVAPVPSPALTAYRVEPALSMS
jgi:hypothetical protein